jgi:hypothetical protein
MNGRIHAEKTTPEERLAAVAKSLCLQMKEKWKRDPDYADFRDVLRPFVQRELLRARIDEARLCSGRTLTDRVRELSEELTAVQLPDEKDLRP